MNKKATNNYIKLDLYSGYKNKRNQQQKQTKTHKKINKICIFNKNSKIKMNKNSFKTS